MDDENKQNSNNNANTPAGEQGAKPRTRRRPRAAEEFRILHAPKNKRERRIAEIIRSRAEEKDFVELLRFEEAARAAEMQKAMDEAGFGVEPKGIGR
jgi:hypothetical protein